MFKEPVKKVKSGEQAAPPVHYMKSFENPQVYFGAIFVACFLYWTDNRYDLLHRGY